eukprot:351140-Chlamydomonas_euryale.AAC.32
MRRGAKESERMGMWRHLLTLLFHTFEAITSYKVSAFLVRVEMHSINYVSFAQFMTHASPPPSLHSHPGDSTHATSHPGDSTRHACLSSLCATAAAEFFAFKPSGLETYEPAFLTNTGSTRRTNMTLATSTL